MAECIHGDVEQHCAICADARGRATGGTSAASAAGKSFAVVYAPTLRADTFLLLNEEGDRWKFRWYRTLTDPAVELAQSAPSSGGGDRSSIVVEHRIAHPHSSTAEGVVVTDCRYWFDVIARTNAEYADRISALRA